MESEAPELISPDFNFLQQVEEESGIKASACYQCKKCTNGCPVTFAMDYYPDQILRFIHLGLKDLALNSATIWVCSSCETCTTRCPNEIWLAPMFDTLRHIALEEGYKPDPTVVALHRSFLNSIKLWGRVHELTMLMEYKVRCLLAGFPVFFRDLASELKMGSGLFLKGKISLLPERIKRVHEVRELYETTGHAAEVE